MGRGMATLDFHHNGYDGLLKHTVLARTGDGWKGLDYASRMITMKELWRIYWEFDSMSWKPI